MFKNYINEKDLIKNLQSLIKIPSVHIDSSNPDTPFGKNTVEALNYTLNLGQKFGFRTKNIDGYCGYIEFGSGDELIGIIGHLDVVPEGGEGSPAMKTTRTIRMKPRTMRHQLILPRVLKVLL